MTQTIQQALIEAQRQLAGSDSPRLDAAVLLCHVLDKPRSYLFAWPERELSEGQRQTFQALLQRRAAGEPVSHLTGTREFWSLELEVDTSTLIPRPDTELLVEIALEQFPACPQQVADLGTGTGAIALALAYERPAWHVTGCDRVAAAISLAERNRRRLGLSNAKFIPSDWCQALPENHFDLIVSNPPYICQDDPHLAQGDVQFEPASALVAGWDGLDAIRHIVQSARSCLHSGGALLLEHGYDQAAAVRELMLAAGYADVRQYRDLGGNDRATLGWMEKKSHDE